MTALAAGTITIGGDLTIHRLGLGTMRLTGPGMFGPPADLDAARAVLRTARDLGIDFIDTANAYGPIVAELVVRETLHPYTSITVATKGGMLRPGPEQWVVDGRPASLRAAVEASLKVLGVERIDLWHLHRIDPNVPAEEQFAAVAEMRRAGLIRHAGLSEVSIEQIEAARAHFPVATVQNAYHVIERRSDPVIDYCEREGIAFIAYFPLATGALAAADSILAPVAARLGMSPAQAAIAWLLARSRALVAIPGTSRVEHLRENVAAAELRLSPEQLAAIEKVGRKAALLRAPKP
ncbi:MAG TPA: aldo/keto reductase [Kofleriaceae bacterium]|nr:aldo/keto reductase [Kofleriaceae bacterium]